MANRVELMGSHIVIESVCGERGGILLGLRGVRVRTEKEAFFFLLFPNDREILTWSANWDGLPDFIFFRYPTLKLRTLRADAVQLIEGKYQFRLQPAADWDCRWYHLMGVFIAQSPVPRAPISYYSNCAFLVLDKTFTVDDSIGFY